MPDIPYLVSQIAELAWLGGLLLGCILGPGILFLLASSAMHETGSPAGFLWGLIPNTIRLLWLILAVPVRLVTRLYAYLQKPTHADDPAPATPIKVIVFRRLPPQTLPEDEPGATRPRSRTRFSFFE